MDTRSGATVPGCLHVHRTVGGQHDTVVTLGRLAADQLVQDVVTHALGVAGERIAEPAAAGWRQLSLPPGQRQLDLRANIIVADQLAFLVVAPVS